MKALIFVTPKLYILHVYTVMYLKDDNTAKLSSNFSTSFIWQLTNQSLRRDSEKYTNNKCIFNVDNCMSC